MENDLISRRAHKNHIMSFAGMFTDELGFVVSLAQVIMAIDAEPAIDAVEVVRCKDCKHWGTGYGGETEHCKVCEYAGYMVGANGYCVYGECKMDAEVEG